MREPVVAHIFKQLCEALEFLHGRNLFHRDLKTENILVSREDGRYALKVADFGRTVFVPPQPFRPRRARAPRTSTSSSRTTTASSPPRR